MSCPLSVHLPICHKSFSELDILRQTTLRVFAKHNFSCFQKIAPFVIILNFVAIFVPTKAWFLSVNMNFKELIKSLVSSHLQNSICIWYIYIYIRTFRKLNYRPLNLIIGFLRWLHVIILEFSIWSTGELN